jgi:hypothetical protein
MSRIMPSRSSSWCCPSASKHATRDDLRVGEAQRRLVAGLQGAAGTEVDRVADAEGAGRVDLLGGVVGAGVVHGDDPQPGLDQLADDAAYDRPLVVDTHDHDRVAPWPVTGLRPKGVRRREVKLRLGAQRLPRLVVQCAHRHGC